MKTPELDLNKEPEVLFFNGKFYSYKLPDGTVITDQPRNIFTHNDILGIAKEIAANDLRLHDRELDDPGDWPREFEIKCTHGWVTVSVDMEYKPSFTSTLNI